LAGSEWREIDWVFCIWNEAGCRHWYYRLKNLNKKSWSNSCPDIRSPLCHPLDVYFCKLFKVFVQNKICIFVNKKKPWPKSCSDICSPHCQPHLRSRTSTRQMSLSTFLDNLFHCIVTHFHCHSIRGALLDGHADHVSDILDDQIWWQQCWT